MDFVNYRCHYYYFMYRGKAYKLKYTVFRMELGKRFILYKDDELIQEINDRNAVGLFVLQTEPEEFVYFDNDIFFRAELFSGYSRQNNNVFYEYLGCKLVQGAKDDVMKLLDTLEVMPVFSIK